ncbi:hypothetical protein HGM15179_020898 [Zosterops borbonicus]|uniref:Ig-like domain-containing protein n=1 Tax=Zosterops borbonicus TaxID=364589 RepID=A0A8K1D8C8_9PASS|nr:hypothetical protein HGM15179_020898 [Zosterops borbonicus]
MARKVALLLWGECPGHGPDTLGMGPGEPETELFMVPVLEGPHEPIEGSPLNLSCLSTPSPLRPPATLLHLFYRDGHLVGGPQVSPQLLVPSVGVSHSGNYSCQVLFEGGSMRKSSAQFRVTVRSATTMTPSFRHAGYQSLPPASAPSVSDPTVPVTNATITCSPPAQQMHAGDSMTLHCSVQVGSAPVTITWLHNGREVAQGPVLELGDVDVGHSGTYQCMATNQLGQDGHRVFRALSPEVALEVTPGSPWVTATTKPQERTSPEEGAVLDPHVVGTEQAGGSKVNRVALPRPHKGQQDPHDTFEKLLRH